MNAHVSVFFFLSVASVSLFSFIAVAVWSQERRREREAYYRSETLKKLAEASVAGSTTAAEILREEQNGVIQRRRESQKLGGLITFAIGIALLVFIHAVDRADPGYLVGLIPLSIGASLLIYAYLLAPRN